MTIRKKIIVFSALALGAFLAIVFLVSRFALMKAFSRMDGDAAQTTVHQMRSALEHKHNNLEAVAHDYAQSDAAYDFLQSKNPDYTKTVLTPDALKALHVDLVAILDNSNNLSFYRIVASWLPDATDLQAITVGGARSGVRVGVPARGVLEVGGHVLLLCYQPVLPSDGTGPSRGTLVMARELDDTEIGMLSTSLGFSVWLEPASTLAQDSHVAWTNGVDSARIESDTTMLDYVAIRDFSGNTCRLLVTRTQRSFFLEGQKESRYLLALLMLAGVVYCGILFFFVEEVLVRRIAFLGSEVSKVTVSGDLSLRLHCEGKDELSMLARTLNTMLSAIQKTKSDLMQAQESLRFHAEHDALTGVLNRRAVRDVLRKELARCRREKNTLGVILGDVDHFKKINDHYGHAAGDAVLVSVVQRITSVLRSYDALGRYGGEEFLIVAPNCDLAMAQKLAERVRSSIADEPMDLGNASAKVTLSLGVTLGTAESDPEFLVAQADTAMYNAKRNGRNRLEVGLDLPLDEPIEIGKR
jgi:diguanylate cyclase (GGDEF)-like protein